MIAAGVLFNHGSSSVALLLSAVLTDYMFLEPVGSFAIDVDIVPWLAFIVICLEIGVVVEAMHVAVHHLHAANRALKSSDSEKDLLLREATHRTRNDLQMLGALIDLQTRSSDEPAVRSALTATRDRVRLLGEVQQRLRRTDGHAVIDMRDFITGLCDDLRNSLLDLRPITLTVDAERHDMSQEQAVPVGLVINELTTNPSSMPSPTAGRAGWRCVSCATATTGWAPAAHWRHPQRRAAGTWASACCVPWRPSSRARSSWKTRVAPGPRCDFQSRRNATSASSRR